ncbi:hypothetical protein Q5P01_021751 [Channa striata]|uniref:Uncharacterized protein n=1 Tax=Channa striata TaxID=64152 RepID=A0AA88LUS8_CHASR|nr:hypothetical protein Q5P01_021751 [Channa striata]
MLSSQNEEELTSCTCGPEQTELRPPVNPKESRVHLNDPVPLEVGRQIASTPIRLSITLLSPSLDPIALTVYRQTR